jgi:hypothetical protein
MTAYLSYGAIGLGLALAVLAYKLLSREQERPADARPTILRGAYVFMTFALVLAAGGFVSEFALSDAAEMPTVSAELRETKAELDSLRAKHQLMREELNVSRSVMRTLIDLKTGKVGELKDLDPESPAYSTLVNSIQRDLQEIDSSLRRALK